MVAQRTKAHDANWQLWDGFCHAHGVDPLMQAVPDAIPYLMVFAQRYRDGKLAKSGQPVRARTVEDTVRSIGQTMAMLGANDCRYAASGKLDLRLTRQLKGFGKTDPQPTRVKPAPFALLAHMQQEATTTGGQRAAAVSDMSLIGFFFLCRPGEHVQTTAARDPGARCSPFRLRNVVFFQGARRLDACTAPLTDIHTADHVQLTYEDQKNAVRAEAVGHGESLHATACPVRTLVRRVTHLRTHHAADDTPLHTYFHLGHQGQVRAADITLALRRAATALFATLGIPPLELSARSLRAGGAMAMLCARIDTDTIQLIGRWRSDAMLRYLHLQAIPHMRSVAPAMIAHGNFTFRPGTDVPNEARPILQPTLPPNGP
jgi:hypothetical protein